MRSLKEFAGTQDVFRTPTDMPAFFDQNLVDPARVVKLFVDDPQAHIKVFYYQFLKLCFELTNPKSEELVQKIEELINNQTFQFIFYQEDDPSIFNDTQAKSFVSQFFGQLSAAECPVLDAINAYPIMDVIMVHFFRTLLILMEKTESLDNFISRDELLSFLCPFFGIDVEIHDSCIKYVDTDVFVYDHTEKEVYMAYINYSEDHGAKEINSESAIEQYVQDEEKFAPKSTVSDAIEPQHHQNRVEAKESYIASEWNDYTHNPAADRLASKGTALKGSEHEIDRFGRSEVEKVADKPVVKNENSTLAQITRQQATFTETASISSGSDNRNAHDALAQVVGQNGFIQNDFLAKSNPVARPPNNPVPNTTPTFIPSSTQIQSNNTDKKTLFEPFSGKNMVQAAPTKDYNQGNQFMPSPLSYQAPKPAQPVPFAKPVTSYESNYGKDLYNSSKVEAPKPMTSYESNYGKDMYNSSKEAPFYNPKVNNVPATSNFSSSKVQSYDYKNVTADLVSKTIPAAPQQIMSPVVSNGKKKVFGLNVSDEFTPPQTINKMAEPFKSNVVNIVSRARQFRNSLSGYLQ